MSGMRDAMWEELRGDLLTPACRRGLHAECPHKATVGGGFNPRRLRFETGAGLCTCGCHQACPAVDDIRIAIPVRFWRDRCTCPGAAAERQRLEEAGFDFRDPGERFEKRRQRPQVRRDALQAVRAASGGKTRDEVRQLYVDEMRSRGVDLPREDIVEAHLDWIAGNPLPALRIGGESLAQAGKGIADLIRMFRSASGGQQ
jgi:hypothetical protein